MEGGASGGRAPLPAQPHEVTPFGPPQRGLAEGRDGAWECKAFWSRTNGLVITEGGFLFKEGATDKLLSDLSHIFVLPVSGWTLDKGHSKEAQSKTQWVRQAATGVWGEGAEGATACFA